MKAHAGMSFFICVSSSEICSSLDLAMFFVLLVMPPDFFMWKSPGLTPGVRR